MNQNNILITGASGAVGFDTFKELLNHNNKFNLRLFLRDSKKNRKLFEPYFEKIEVVWGDLRNYGAIRKAIEDQDIIVHIAGVIPPLADKNPEYAYKVNVEGTRKILRAMQNSNSAQKIIYTSSIAVYGDRLENPYIKKSDTLNPNDNYAETKLKAEESIKNSSVDYIIFRLSYCTSIRSFEIKPLMFEVPLETCLEIIDTRDVGLAISKAIMSTDLWNKIFNLAGGEECRVKYKEYLNNIFKIVGLGKNFLPEEAFAKDGFHCGFYETNELQKKIKFQRYTLEDFYSQIEKWIGFKKYFASIFKWLIKKYLLRKSKYYKNHKD